MAAAGAGRQRPSAVERLRDHDDEDKSAQRLVEGVEIVLAHLRDEPLHHRANREQQDDAPRRTSA